MKIFAIILTLVFSSSVYAANIRDVRNWNPNIPTSPSKILEVVSAEAGYFSFETDAGVCGGEVSQSSLSDYSSFTTEDGNEIHEMTIHFQVSKSENYCQSETLTSCEAPIQVLSENGIVMGEWLCEN